MVTRSLQRLSQQRKYAKGKCHGSGNQRAESEKEYTVELAAPGLSKEDFDVNINVDGDLTIKMEKKEENESEKNAHYLRREFSYSKYEQTLILPDDVDRDKIAARVNNGVLTVVLPKIGKQEQKMSRSIEVG